MIQETNLEKIPKIANLIKYLFPKIIKQSKLISCKCNLEQLVLTTQELITTITKKLFYLNNEKSIFFIDLQNSIQTIHTALDCYLTSLNSIQRPMNETKLIQLIESDLIILTQSLIQFSSSISGAMQGVSNIQKLSKAEIERIDTLIGLESLLFTLSVNVEESKVWPFFHSKYLAVYQFYGRVRIIKSKISAIQSLYGTGKTTCIPVMLMIESIRNQTKSPFFLFVEPNEKSIEKKTNFFNTKLAKYVTIENDPAKFLEMMKNYNSYQNSQRLVMGIMTPFKLQKMMFEFRDNKKLFSHTKLIIDDANQRTLDLDVLIGKIASLHQNTNTFSMPSHVTLISSLISNDIKSPFNGQIETTDLVEKPKFEINESPVVRERFTKDNNEVAIRETNKVIEEMAEFYSKVEVGHILCFLSDADQCHKYRDSLLFSEQNEYFKEKGIIIMQTTLKNNESIDNFFKRLQNELEINESINQDQNVFLYFMPIVLTENDEDRMLRLAENEFPEPVRRINKIICTTQNYQSTINTDGLSVVIDNGLEEESGFDTFTGLKTINERFISFETKNERKGRLGYSKRGTYIPIYPHPNFTHYPRIPEIQKRDLTTDILIYKTIGIDIEKMKTLPTIQNRSVLDYSIKNLIWIGAIDAKSNRITYFGTELLKFPFISIYYAASVFNFRDSFYKNYRQQAYFISAYISTVIEMDSKLIQNDLTEKLSRFFREDSDIITLINSLNSLLLSKITDETEFKNLVEKFGFSYRAFLEFKQNMQIITNETFPGKTTPEVILLLGSFIKENKGISPIINNFISKLENNIPNWRKIHLVEFKCMSGAGNFENKPILVFTGSDRLKFRNQPRNRPHGGVRIFSRPGWNGCIIPSECYCFNIVRKMNSVINVGRLIHHKYETTKNAIFSMECEKTILNPWFDVLISTYFENYHRFFKHFVTSTSNDEQPEPQQTTTSRRIQSPATEKRIFHYSKVEERVFISFIPRDNSICNEVTEGIKKCLKLIPFTPRSILIYRNDIKSLVEVTSIGAQHYESTCINSLYGRKLTEDDIDYCLNNLNELANSNSNVRICALFINDQCKLNDYDQRNLYIVYQERDYMQSPILNIVQERFRDMSGLSYYSSFTRTNQRNNEFGLFQFPSKFIHPALFYNPESLDIIMTWFIKHCPYAKVIKVVGHRLLMKSSDIFQLQHHFHQEKQLIKEQMKLNYVAIPVPKKIHVKDLLVIKNNPNWEYNEKFRVIVTTREEEDKVNEFISHIETDTDDEEETLCCIYVCDDPENPLLTNYPITIYYQDGKTYTNQMCRDCLVSSLQIATESFFANGQIDQFAIEKINFKPPVIPSVNSKETEDGLQCWPQIPLGQMISSLINNDYELSSLVSAWLNSVNEYTIRTQAKLLYTFCPDHPHKIFKINSYDINEFCCQDGACKNRFCEYCQSWHPDSYICEERKDGKKCVWKKFCPKCKTPTFKDSGCNHITCPCGCHWCYKCGMGFQQASQCYAHLSAVHGGCFDYHFDD